MLMILAKKFGKSITNSEQLDLFVILLRNHFVFLWFTCTTSCLTLVDSTPKSETHDIAILRNSLLYF